MRGTAKNAHPSPTAVPHVMMSPLGSIATSLASPGSMMACTSAVKAVKTKERHIPMRRWRRRWSGGNTRTIVQPDVVVFIAGSKQIAWQAPHTEDAIAKPRRLHSTITNVTTNKATNNAAHPSNTHRPHPHRGLKLPQRGHVLVPNTQRAGGVRTRVRSGQSKHGDSTHHALAHHRMTHPSLLTLAKPTAGSAHTSRTAPV